MTLPNMQRGLVEGPLLYVIVAMGVMLALSTAGNAYFWHERDALIQKEATVSQLEKDTKANALVCKASVEALGEKTDAQGKALLGAIRGVAPAVKAHQEEAILALTATPEDAANLCGSLLTFWRSKLPLKTP